LCTLNNFRSNLTLECLEGAMPFRDRRDFMRGLLACTCGLCVPAHALSETRESRGYCFDALQRDDPSEARSDMKNLLPLAQSSDLALVAYIEREYELLSQFFGRRAELYFDANEDGAYVERKTGRYIVLGNPFIESYTGRKYGLLMVSGILAHEQSHVFQIHWKINFMLENVKGHEVKQVEIHADYLAGAYMAWRGKRRNGAPGELAALFYELGDRKYRQKHHGTSEERFLAFARGYHDLQKMKSGSADVDVRTAAAKGLQYVQETLQ
jgi:hypothetical protein